MRIVSCSILGSFAVMALLTAMWPSGGGVNIPSNLNAQDQTFLDKETEPSEKVASVRFSPGTERTIKAEQALKEIVSLKFDKTPFSKVEQKLETLSGLNFVLHQSASDDDLSLDDEISFELIDTPLDKALSLLLGTKNATYVIDDGIVILISLDEANDDRWLRLKMYDCRDLVKSILAKNRPDPNGEQTLLDMVQSMISPDNWEEGMGGRGTVVLVNGTLIVKQTELIHQQIEKFLGDLEASVLLRTRSGVIKKGTNNQSRPSDSQTGDRGSVRVLNLPPVSSAKTADQLIQQLETRQYVRPTIPLSKGELEKAAAKLKDRFPMRSIRDRLHFQAGEPATEDLPSYSDRHGANLAALHSGNIDSFINRSGQGVGRTTNLIGPRVLFALEVPFAEKAKAIPVASALLFEEEVEVDKTVKMKESRYRARMGEMDPDADFVNSLSPDGLPKQQALSIFNSRAAASFAEQKTGFVKNIDEVAGFEAHRIRFDAGWPGNLRPSVKALKARDIKPTSQSIAWKVNRLQLVSLLMHDQPCVYDVDELPDMKNLNSETVNTRPLNDFETSGLKALESGEELLVRATKNRIVMAGAIRASKGCLACHTGKQGDLLGAFSYEFLRHPRTQSQRSGLNSGL